MTDTYPHALLLPLCPISFIHLSTAKLPQVIKNGYWSDSLSEFGFESTTAHVGFAPDADGRGFQVRMDTKDGNSIRLYLSASMGLLQRFEASSGWVTLKTLY